MKQWRELTYKEISLLNRDILVLIPVGTIEAHGAHLPVTTDTLIPQYFCQEISKKVDAVIGPEILFGICDSMIKFPGTITVQEKTMEMLLRDYLQSIISYGFHNIYLLNGHGGNEGLLKKITAEYSQIVNIRAKDWYDFEEIDRLKEKIPSYRGDHADRLETEMLMYPNRKLVNLEKAVDDFFVWPEPDPDEYSEVMLHAVYGSPSQSTQKTAKQYFLEITDLLVKDINNFLKNGTKT